MFSKGMILPRRFTKPLTNADPDIAQRIIEAESSQSKPRSCIFFTTHKCASVFSERLLNVITASTEYRIMDYAGRIWAMGDRIQVEGSPKPFLEAGYDRLYRLKGEIYAPQREPIDFPGRQQFKHIFFLRDPRDVLVSSYFSFAFTHSKPRNKVRRAAFEAQRSRMIEDGIDAYVLGEGSNWLQPIFADYRRLWDNSTDSLFVKYDEYINDTEGFIRKIASYLGAAISEKDVTSLAEEAAPVQNKVNSDAHKRSGLSGQFREELDAATVAQLKKIFSEELAYWDFA